MPGGPILKIHFREEDATMTMDKSLRIRRGLIRSRSVLTRAERLTRLLEADLWKAGDSPLGLPKVRVFKLAMKKKKKKKEEEGAEGAEGAVATAAAAPAADAKKTDAKKGDAKKPDAKKPEAKKTDSKKSETKKK
jgi:small basic protein (TIGR04137 family)